MSPVRRITVGLVVAAVAVLAIAAPASAHDSLVHSTPGADEALAAPPESIVLTFSGELLVLGDSTLGAVVIVIDEDGRDWATGEVEVEGNTVTAAVDSGMPDAGYQVRWQVVSEDGHPISGIVPFTIGDAAPLASSSASASANAGANADDDAVSDASTDGDDSAQGQTSTDSGGIPRVLLIGGGGAVLAALAFVLYRTLRRPRTASAASADGDAAEEQL